MLKSYQERTAESLAQLCLEGHRHCEKSTVGPEQDLPPVPRQSVVQGKSSAVDPVHDDVVGRYRPRGGPGPELPPRLEPREVNAVVVCLPAQRPDGRGDASPLGRGLRARHPEVTVGREDGTSVGFHPVVQRAKVRRRLVRSVRRGVQKVARLHSDRGRSRVDSPGGEAAVQKVVVRRHDGVDETTVARFVDEVEGGSDGGEGGHLRQPRRIRRQRRLGLDLCAAALLRSGEGRGDREGARGYGEGRAEDIPAGTFGIVRLLDGARRSRGQSGRRARAGPGAGSRARIEPPARGRRWNGCGIRGSRDDGRLAEEEARGGGRGRRR
mmetsp:Transcript_16533/g.47595  ORF Transcript_16533/g.47595 Transcript_16533/m.47595 type:complete len:325 (+) Transcript_16533:366-1340(+)